MGLWLVAMEAMIYEEVEEVDTAAEAIARAMAQYEGSQVEVTHIVAVDIMTDKDDTSLRDRLAEEEEFW